MYIFSPVYILNCLFKLPHLYVFSSVFSNLYYIGKPLGTNHKVMVSKLYVLSNVSSNLFFWESLWTLVTRIRFITCMCSQMSIQIFIIWECLRTQKARVCLQIYNIYRKPWVTHSKGTYFYPYVFSHISSSFHVVRWILVVGAWWGSL